ncbi:hypothetical protein, partial [Agrobacterium bohemicum]|uniref:hypothetical protein n=1 Tax=Agrobacterium bohemicum TaxID=2052828 RepID=UPI001AED0FA4
QAHNLKAAGSNPAPATKNSQKPNKATSCAFLCSCPYSRHGSAHEIFQKCPLVAKLATTLVGCEHHDRGKIDAEPFQHHR